MPGPTLRMLYFSVMAIFPQWDTSTILETDVKRTCGSLLIPWTVTLVVFHGLVATEEYLTAVSPSFSPPLVCSLNRFNRVHHLLEFVERALHVHLVRTVVVDVVRVLQVLIVQQADQGGQVPVPVDVAGRDRQDFVRSVRQGIRELHLVDEGAVRSLC